MEGDGREYIYIIIVDIILWEKQRWESCSLTIFVWLTCRSDRGKGENGC